jgi:hypothetical protein
LPKPLLRLKHGYCPICNDGQEKEMISGVCRYHYWAKLRQNTTLPAKNGGPYRDISRQNEEDPALERWYRDIVQLHKGSPHCWNCGHLVAVWNYTFAKAAVAHILPKKTFLSINTHPLNYLFLGADCCHNLWDRSWSSASEMKIFPVALERYRQFAPAIALAERKEIPEIFNLT